MATQDLAYRAPSTLTDDGLALQTSGGATPAGPATHPAFFRGFMTRPEQCAQGLIALSNVAQSRYHQPNLAYLRDPVATSHGDRVRFESFSGCCGVYARMDVLEGGLDGDILGRGTTNVDINPPLREALARVGGGEPLRVEIGADELAVDTLDGRTVERKVPLPERWVRGFAEVAPIVAGMRERAVLDAVAARRFLRGLPRSGGAPLWVVASGRGLRVTARPASGAIALAGPSRLDSMIPLLRFASGLRIWGPDVDSRSHPVASAWELVLGDARYVVVLSPDATRGFSGEGAALHLIADDEADRLGEYVADELAWDPTISAATIAGATGLGADRVTTGLAQLGASGRVGFDLAEGSYFHRELPYESDVEKANPRLRNARRLVAQGAVRIEGSRAVVTVDDHVQHITLGDATSCTCQWWAKYQGTRGPCKHVLAVQILLGVKV